MFSLHVLSLVQSDITGRNAPMMNLSMRVSVFRKNIANVHAFVRNSRPRIVLYKIIFPDFYLFCTKSHMVDVHLSSLSAENKFGDIIYSEVGGDKAIKVKGNASCCFLGAVTSCAAQG